MTRRRRLFRIALPLLAMPALAAAVALSAYDEGRTEMTRFRNALLAKAGGAGDFNWTPANMPADFVQEHAPVPVALAQWHSLAGEGDVVTRVLGIARALPRYGPLIEQEQGLTPTVAQEDAAHGGAVLPHALSIARTLSNKPRLGGQIAASTLVTLAKIESTGTGYCVDYTKVFSALAYAAGIPVRQWSFSFDGFGGWGHTFNEFWDIAGQRWIMIDVFEGFYPRDRKTGAPLSALEFRERLLSSPASIQWERIAPPLFGFKDDATALQYFQRGANEWYLAWGNITLGYDEQPLVVFASRFGRLPEQVAAVLTGVQPGIRVMLHDGNQVAFARLMRLRYWLFSAAALELILLMDFVGACFVHRG